MSAERRLHFVTLTLALVGCHHTLDLALTLSSSSCTVPVPAGGSILYEVLITGPDGSGASTSCGGCLAVPTTLADENAILAFLRANAPSCSSVAPNSELQVALTAWSIPSCSDARPSARVFCSASPSVPIPDGHADAVLSAVLSCDPTCGANLGSPDMGTCVSGCAVSTCAPCCTVSYSGTADSDQSCPTACSCLLSCSGPDTCHFSCEAGSTCSASADNANAGVVDCKPGANCQLKCGASLGDRCTLNCNGGACLIECSGGNCDLTGCLGMVTTCPGNVRVCGRACP
jgi:hypothetical protein